MSPVEPRRPTSAFLSDEEKYVDQIFGMDVHKATVSTSTAQAGMDGPIRLAGIIQTHLSGR